ncbi:fatty acid desaturase [Acidisoma silvae]|uniref:Fatty acid desaturase n=1 Tax=Acidisoma silvae TaxID=2802396 RepID=A0A963YV92_9PROT|nr:fatty acid desaturase [Acidisoma silvae]MCB8877708.1 fatty acid desaturase [Acidisoma silvae]
MKHVWKNYRLRDETAGMATANADGDLGHAVGTLWYACPVSRKQLKELMRRSDGPALRFFALWLALLAVAGMTAFFAWGTWWAIPTFFIYGTLYAVADHRHHELSHGTGFRTRWINEMFYHLCAFITLREGFYYRWSHSRHHTHTLLVGKDPEIAAPRPPNVWAQFLDFFFLHDGYVQVGRLLQNATGNLTEDGKYFVPDGQRRAVIWASRAYLAIILAVAVICVAAHSILPAMFVILPRFYGGVLCQVFNLTQHAGLDEDVFDHRLNTRTVIMNPVFAFLYANMNYHIEHHMFPMVPFYRLPQLHRLIRQDCPPPYRGVLSAWAELLPALIRQRREPAYFVQRQLPAHARLPSQAAD